MQLSVFFIHRNISSQQDHHQLNISPTRRALAYSRRLNTIIQCKCMHIVSVEYTVHSTLIVLYTVQFRAGFHIGNFLGSNLDPRPIPQKNYGFRLEMQCFKRTILKMGHSQVFKYSLWSLFYITIEQNICLSMLINMFTLTVQIIVLFSKKIDKAFLKRFTFLIFYFIEYNSLFNNGISCFVKVYQRHRLKKKM